MNRKGFIVLLCAMSIFAVGFLGFGSNKDVIATVGNQKITLAELNERLDSFPPQVKQQFETKENKVKLLDELINEKLLVMSAKKESYNKKPEFKKQVEMVENRLLVNYLVQDKIDTQATVTDEEIAAYYNANKASFQATELRKASHILVDNGKDAKVILAAIKGGQNFAEVAKKRSLDSTAANGGDLGWFKKGQLVPEFDKSVFSLKKRGDISGVVKTQFGYHIIKLEDISVRPAKTLAEAKEDIRQALLTQKRQAAMQSFLAAAKDKIKITRNVSQID